MDEENNVDMTNVQVELLYCGTMYESPDIYINYGSSIRSKYDFSDEACRFLYDEFESYYLTFSQEITENKVNNYMSQNSERFKTYRKYGGWKTIKSMMDLSDPNDIKNVYSILKKYSLLREYARNGYAVEKIFRLKNFQTLNASDVYRLIRTKCDKINTVISNVDEPSILTENTTQLVNHYLEKPEFGLHSDFHGFDTYFRGYLRSKVLFNGCLSNEGKSRYMTKIICDIALKQRQRCMLLSNEQTELDFHNALIATVAANDEFRELHGIDIQKPEGEITQGNYRSDITGEFMQMKRDKDGTALETIDEYIQRLNDESTEYRKIQQISNWVDEQTKDKLIRFLDVSQDYSDDNLDMQIRKAKVCYGCDYIFYDTMKSWQLEDWTRFKLTATKLCECAKQNHLYIMSSFQLTDATVFDDIFNLTSNNIGACKGIKTVCDMLTLCKKIAPEEYGKYQYRPFKMDEADETWGEIIERPQIGRAHV